MISSLTSRSSAGFFALGGLAMLFAPDLVLSTLLPGFPASGLWLAQLLGAAWLGLAWMNWINRSVLLGGIYARAVVGANAVCYFVGASSLLKVLTQGAQPAALWIFEALMLAFALVYGWLLLRGPFERDLTASAAAGRAAS